MSAKTHQFDILKKNVCANQDTINQFLLERRAYDSDASHHVLRYAIIYA